MIATLHLSHATYTEHVVRKLPPRAEESWTGIDSGGLLMRRGSLVVHHRGREPVAGEKA